MRRVAEATVPVALILVLLALAGMLRFVP